ncbi:MAG: glutathione S-transferase family protein [Polyangiales bacterium]
MGSMIDGVWQADEALPSQGGRFARHDSKFRHWITEDGRAGPTGEAGFRAEPGRYHLYIARACPWAHRTTILRALKGLESMIGLSVTHWLMADQGWTFADGPGVVPDQVHGVRAVWELYARNDAHYTGRVTVPVLWDRQTSRIVSNESADILRMFNRAFDGCGAREADYSPPTLLAEIDELNARIYDTLNNGVYKSGFASTQEAYQEAVVPVFETLDWLEARLSGRRWLVGEQLTEADIRLFTTLLRFDLVYHGHFKCNLRRIVDYPRLWAYTRALYQYPGVRETVDFEHIKRHYYESHRHLNPRGIVPLGPVLDFDAPA